jgi:hypothetical protein
LLVMECRRQVAPPPLVGTATTVSVVPNPPALVVRG